MADERRIVIVLSVAGGEDEEEEKNPKSEATELVNAKKAARQLVEKVQDATYNLIMNQAEYQFDKYISLSEDYKTQVFVNNVKTTIDKVKSLGTQTYAFAKLGFVMGGAAGGVVAGAAGFLFGVASESLNIMRQYSAQNLNLQMNDRQAFFAQSRLGLIDNGRGTQN